MKKEFLAYGFILMVVFAFGGLNLLGRIHVFEPVKVGDEAELYINVHNPLNEDFNDLIVKAFFLDIPDFTVSPEFDMDEFQTSGKILSLDIPEDTPNGDHIVKVTVSNDDVYDAEYVYLRVI